VRMAVSSTQMIEWHKLSKDDIPEFKKPILIKVPSFSNDGNRPRISVAYAEEVIVFERCIKFYEYNLEYNFDFDKVSEWAYI
jgi:hypothetical protein